MWKRLIKQRLKGRGRSSTWESAGWQSASWRSAGWESAGWQSAAPGKNQANPEVVEKAAAQ